MFRRYALFTIKFPKLHILNLCIVIVTMLISTYQLIENESLLFANGIAFVLACTVIFSRASEYKRKFLSHK